MISNIVSTFYRYKAFILKHVLETFLYKLMCSANQVKIVYVVELDARVQNIMSI